MESKIGEANNPIFIFGWCEIRLMAISYNNLFVKVTRNSMLLKIIIILSGVVKQQVRFTANSDLYC